MSAVAAEVTRVYLTLSSIACRAAKLDSVMFPDSAIARKTTCGCTKAESIITNILTPKSVKSITNDLASGDDLKRSCFAVSTDASNMKNRKMFPVCIQYFTTESGVNKKLLDFLEQNDEHPVPVAEMIRKSLSSHSLDINNVSAYSADNASVNYGSKQSVFTELKALNGRLVKANCNAHIVHNTLKKVTDVIDCDVQTIVTCVLRSL